MRGWLLVLSCCSIIRLCLYFFTPFIDLWLLSPFCSLRLDLLSIRDWRVEECFQELSFSFINSPIKHSLHRFPWIPKRDLLVLSIDRHDPCMVRKLVVLVKWTETDEDSILHWVLFELLQLLLSFSSTFSCNQINILLGFFIRFEHSSSEHWCHQQCVIYGSSLLSSDEEVWGTPDFLVWGERDVSDKVCYFRKSEHSVRLLWFVLAEVFKLEQTRWWDSTQVTHRIMPDIKLIFVLDSVEVSLLFQAGVREVVLDGSSPL